MSNFLILNPGRALATALAVDIFLVSSRTSSAESVDEIVERYLEATGGREAHEAVTSFIRKGKGSLLSAGLEIEIEVYHEGGNFKQTIRVPGMGEMNEGITGGVAWQSNPMEGDKILEGDGASLMREAATINPLLDWNKTYASAEVAGEENGATIVAFKSADGRETRLHFDNASGLQTKRERINPEGDLNVLNYSDYRSVDGIKVPHQVRQETGSATLELTLDSVQFNVKIPEGALDLPDAIKALSTETP